MARVRGELKVIADLHGASFAGQRNVLRLDYGDDCTTQYILKTTESSTFKW